MMTNARSRAYTMSSTMRAVFLFFVCLIAATLNSHHVEGRNLRELEGDIPVASPVGEPSDVFVDDPAPTPVDTIEEGGNDTAGGDNPGDEPTPADDTASEPTSPADDATPEPTPPPADDTTPPPAPADGTEGTTPPPNDEGDGGGDVAEPTAAPVADDANDIAGGGGEDGTTPAPSISSNGVVPAPTEPSVAYSPPSVAPVEDYDVESPTDGEDNVDWDEYTPPTEKPVVYVPPDEEGDPVKDEPGGTGAWLREGETPEEMMHDRNVLIAVSVLCGVGILLTIITAHQMVENPDGCCASVCRLVVGCTCCILRTICFPCRAICCGGSRKRRARQHQMLSDNGNYTHDLELS